MSPGHLLNVTDAFPVSITCGVRRVKLCLLQNWPTQLSQGRLFLNLLVIPLPSITSFTPLSRCSVNKGQPTMVFFLTQSAICSSSIIGIACLRPIETGLVRLPSYTRFTYLRRVFLGIPKDCDIPLAKLWLAIVS